MIGLAMHGVINRNIAGKNSDMRLKSETFQLTKVQAGILVDALSEANFDTYVSSEVARQTQTELKTRFDMD